MSRIPALMDAVAEQIRGFYEGSNIDIQVHGRFVTNPSDPCIDIFPGEPESRDGETAAFHEIDSGGYLFTVRARANFVDSDAGQETLLRLMDDEDDLSLARAIYEDTSLGGLAFDTHLRNPTGFLQFPNGWVGVRWTCLVINAIT